MAGGIAYATIPQSSGVIHGCYQTSGGSLRVIGTNPTVGGGKCSPGETALDWNQTGPQGEAGTAVAFASVSRLGDVAAAGSKNVSAANVTHPADGLYCFGGLGFTPRSVVVTPISGIDANLNPTFLDTIATAVVVFPPDTTAFGCADTDTVRVRTVAVSSPGTLTDRPFMIWFED
jgi:hypothetical protein